MNRARCRSWLPTIRTLMVVCAGLALAPHVTSGQQTRRSWNEYGGGPDSAHYSAARQITKANVGRLEIAWTYPPAASGTAPVRGYVAFALPK